MRQVGVILGWFLFVAGGAAIVYPLVIVLGIGLLKYSYIPSLVELVPTITLVIVGTLFVFLGSYLKRPRKNT
jgi:hypothetical protein